MRTESLLFLLLLAFTQGLTTRNNNSRRGFISNVATATVVVATQPAFAAAEKYDLDMGEVAASKKEVPRKSGGGAGLVGGALAGGLLLSVPFFAPNLARLAGVKNAKLPPKK